MSGQTYTIKHSVTGETVDYWSHDCLTFGDYGGAGSLGLANIRTLESEYADSCDSADTRTFYDPNPYMPEDGDRLVESKPEIVVCHGSYGSQQAFLRADISEETQEQFDRYPALDEEEMTRVEDEWLDEAWNDWLKADLIKEAFKADEDEWERVEAMPDSDLLTAFWAAMESCNEYPIAELSNVFVRVELIAESFASHVRAIVKA